MKKGNEILGLILGIFAVSFVSAAFYSGYSGTFSLGDFLNQVDSSTLILGSIFIISFALLNFASGKYFGDNKAISGGISFAVSLLIIYAINRSGMNFDSFLYSIGFSTSALLPVMYLIFFAAFIFLIVKFGFAKTLIAFGFLLVIVSFIPGIIYEVGVSLLFGVLLIIIGAWISGSRALKERRKKSEGSWTGQKPNFMD